MFQLADEGITIACFIASFRNFYPTSHNFYPIFILFEQISRFGYFLVEHFAEMNDLTKEITLFLDLTQLGESDKRKRHNIYLYIFKAAPTSSLVQPSRYTRPLLHIIYFIILIIYANYLFPDFVPSACKICFPVLLHDVFDRIFYYRVSRQ